MRSSTGLPATPSSGEILLEEMSRFPSIRGIYNMSSGSRSIASVRQRRSDGGRMAYITHELTASRKALLKAGLIDAVIDHNNTVAARSVLGFLAAHFGRLPQLQPEPFTPFEIYLRENC